MGKCAQYFLTDFSFVLLHKETTFLSYKRNFCAEALWNVGGVAVVSEQKGYI
jgi:hypothetical protein